MLWQGTQNISLECQTLCASARQGSKGKAACRCAETVNGCDSLWKALEKEGNSRDPTEEIAPQRRSLGGATGVWARIRAEGTVTLRVRNRAELPAPSTTSVAANPLPGSNHARILPINLSCFRGEIMSLP